MTPEEAFLNDVGSWPIFTDWLEEQGQLKRAALFRRPRFSNSLDMEFVLVPKGKFWLGGSGGRPGNKKVTIPHDFYLGACQVTQAQWLKLMLSNPSWFSRDGEGTDEVRDIPDVDLARFPVEMVSWDKAQAFLQKLNAREPDGGWTYRLPTEAEWEYACRGGPVSKEACSFDFYCTSPTNDLTSNAANFDGNYPAGKGKKGPFLGRTTRVGSYQPNRLGLYDMHGNVWEWCDDVQGSQRVFRGGSWDYSAEDCQAAYRLSDKPGSRGSFLGLRLARVPVK